jgi:hypothetical protein
VFADQRQLPRADGKGKQDQGAPNLADDIWLTAEASRRSSRASGPDAAA